MLVRADGNTLVQYAAHLLLASLDLNLKGGGEGGVGEMQFDSDYSGGDGASIFFSR